MSRGRPLLSRLIRCRRLLAAALCPRHPARCGCRHRPSDHPATSRKREAWTV